MGHRWPRRVVLTCNSKGVLLFAPLAPFVPPSRTLPRKQRERSKRRDLKGGGVREKFCRIPTGGRSRRVGKRGKLPPVGVRRSLVRAARERRLQGSDSCKGAILERLRVRWSAAQVPLPASVHRRLLAALRRDLSLCPLQLVEADAEP